MATTSTLVTFKQAFIDALKAKVGTGAFVDTQVAYGWPGPSAARELIAWGNVTGFDHEIPTIKSGRKQRQEELRPPLVVWVFDPESDPLSVKDVEARAFELLALAEDVAADDPQVNEAIQWATIASGEVVTVPFGDGWAVAITANFEVQARLT